MSVTIPAAIHDALLYKVVTVEMTNGLTATGRVVAFDPATMNMQLDCVSEACLRSISTGEVLQHAPPQLLAAQVLTVRGGSIHSIDMTLPVVVDSVARAAATAKACA